jgi:hypothetical protein
MVSAWLWQRMAPMRTHRPSIGMLPGERKAGRPRILLHSAPPFHSSFDWPSLDRHVDPRDQAAGERHAAEVLRSGSRRAHGLGDLAVDVEDRRSRIGEQP